LENKIHYINNQLHALEDEIIQMQGLVKVLQQINLDDSGPICITLSIEEKLGDLQYEFYKHWKILMDELY